MKSPDKVFKASAFEPTDEELSNHIREKKQAKRDAWRRKRSPSPIVIDIPDVLDDSDDDLPEVGAIFSTPLKKQRQKLAAKKAGRVSLCCASALLCDDRLMTWHL